MVNRGVRYVRNSVAGLKRGNDRTEMLRPVLNEMMFEMVDFETDRF
jgi:hypothetical protein